MFTCVKILILNNPLVYVRSRKSHNKNCAGHLFGIINELQLSADVLDQFTNQTGNVMPDKTPKSVTIYTCRHSRLLYIYLLLVFAMVIDTNLNNDTSERPRYFYKSLNIF